MMGETLRRAGDGTDGEPPLWPRQYFSEASSVSVWLRRIRSAKLTGKFFG
jgi:hypothetical protein